MSHVETIPAYINLRNHEHFHIFRVYLQRELFCKKSKKINTEGGTNEFKKTKNWIL